MSAPDIPPGVNFLSEEPEGVTYGPDMFYAQDQSAPTPQLNEPLPKAWSHGGVIESVKRAVVASIRTGLRGTSLGQTTGEDELFEVDIEYPIDVTKYPAVWVQFSIETLQRAGLAMQAVTQDHDGNWGPIQEWNFTGRITLSIAALSSKDRDRLADTVISSLAFSRAPDLVIRQNSDAQQDRGLITAINNNPYVAMTLNTDQIMSGGQTVTGGTPWAPNILLYEDNYAVTCQGQFNIRFGFDGAYTLTSINVVSSISADEQAFNPNQWLGSVLPPWYPR
jgi:hypothetical protein